MITSATNQTEKKQTLQGLQMLAERTMNRAEKEIKLIYVTVRTMSDRVLAFHLMRSPA
jgi:hypothetical protein